MEQFKKATMVREGNYDQAVYMERTKRNHYWTGGGKRQKAIHDLKIGVAGLGGMGSNIANALARLGVGHIRIADPDIIEASNINRQVIANSKTVGEKKAVACFNDIKKIGDDFDIVAYDQGITEEVVEEFVKGCDIVIDEIDVYPLDKHVLLHDVCNRYNIPIYTAFVVGLGIHLYKFQGNDYTIRNFLGEEEKWKKPTAEFIIEKFAYPCSTYLEEKQLATLIDELKTGNVPIFGTSCLMGHSMVSMRAIIDYLSEKYGDELRWGDIKQTPTMPNFIKIDPIDMSFSIANALEFAR